MTTPQTSLNEIIGIIAIVFVVIWAILAIVLKVKNNDDN